MPYAVFTTRIVPNNVPPNYCAKIANERCSFPNLEDAKAECDRLGETFEGMVSVMDTDSFEIVYRVNEEYDPDVH